VNRPLRRILRASDRCGSFNSALEHEWRSGGTLTINVDLHNSLKLYGGKGATIAPGTNYDIIGVSWQYKWGAGL
jgi:hypothetical protein